MNNSRVTEVRSSLGHKVKRATSNLIGSREIVNTAIYWRNTEVTYITTNIILRKTKKPPSNKKKQAIKTRSFLVVTDFLHLICVIDNPI